VRIFIAVELSEETRRVAAEAACIICRRVGGRATRPENLHITVRFLGECDPGRLPAVREAMEEAAQDTAPFMLAPGRPGVFRRGRDSVVWLEPAGDREALRRLHGRLERSLAGKGFDRDDRPFTAHLTLARQVPEARLDALPGLPADEAAVTAADHIALMRSAHADGRLVYTALERVQLRGTERAVVDRMEDGWAVCRALGDGRERLLHRSRLPDGIGEGDVLAVGPGGIIRDEDETLRRRRDARRALERWKP
jgi:2'-5' RNA ligase